VGISYIWIWLSNTVWASATFGFGYDEESGTNMHNDYVHVSFGVANVRVGTTGRLAVYETSCLDVIEDLIKLLFARAAEAGMRMGLDRFRT
jgi:hypothetical protein